MPASTPIDPRWLAAKPLANARAGDRLILGKPLGRAIYQTARARGQLEHHDQTLLDQDVPQGENSARILACLEDVHSLQAIDGCSLIGALEALTQGAHLRASLHLDHIPRLPSALDLAEGQLEAASHWTNYAANHCWLAPDGKPLALGWQALLGTIETGGGLLVSCAPETVTEVLSLFLQQDFSHAAVIGILKPFSRHRRQLVLH